MSGMDPSFLEKFQALEAHLKESLARIELPLQLGLAALYIAHESGQDRMTLGEIHAALEAADISVKRLALGRAFSRAGDRVTGKDIHGAASYRLTVRGRREAARLLPSGGLEVLYVEGDKPRSDRKEVAAVLSGLAGVVRISDPYFGIRSLDALEAIPQGTAVRFLTANVSGDRARLKGPMRDFTTERPSVEFRLTAKPNDLHDRFILGDGQLILVGHGLKDIGGKESFVIVIPREFAPDMVRSVQGAFEKRWNNATRF